MTRSTRIPTAYRQWLWAMLAAPVLGAALWMACAPAAHAGDAADITPFSSARGAEAPAPWRFTTLPNKTPTRFEVVQQDGRRVLKVEADQSYGNLVHATQVPLDASTTLAWRWRVDDFVKDADLRKRSGDDGAAKLCVFFDLPTDRLSFGERTRLALARRTTGEQVPSEALCYVWDNKEAKGSTLVNAFTQRMRMVVLESGPAATPGTWASERRNLLADYRRVFGDEAGDTMPDVVAVAISADADNTQGHGLAYFSDIDLRSIAPTRSAGGFAAGRPVPGE
ncbi:MULTISPECIES: DUF3047 domain-containing protein [unclassified Variovorax]|uniref:DUF3047 domain-containing protein n=1 Tax=unclassified Variovorax TaxID=663243 RepID=UPI00088B23DD|nr:DUF3047 domain-containing protein [Variovorax sp. CF079]SDE16331.1 Protein of unknown function [Variovorax sp. CF079]